MTRTNTVPWRSFVLALVAIAALLCAACGGAPAKRTVDKEGIDHRADDTEKDLEKKEP